MTKLKPCPFCGETQFIDIYGIYDQNGDEIGSHITCGGCMAHFRVEDAVNRDEVIAGWNRRAEETPPQGWISVKDGLPPERDTIFAKLYGTDKWRSAMFRKMSDDVRVVKIFRDGTRRVHHDYTVDGVWDSERKGADTYGRVTHWMPNPELPRVIECNMCGEAFTEDDLADFRDMGEAYHQDNGCFLCPDCWDTFRRMDPEEQAKIAITNKWRAVQHEE